MKDEEKTEFIEEMLSQLNPIVEQHVMAYSQKEKNGDCFNIFNVLGIKTKEVQTHSPFLAYLLSPNENHGCGASFLEAFINEIAPLKELHFDISNAKTSIEYYIGAKNADETEGGRLDIMISSGKQAIIIENKIGAQDQSNQILRYWNYTNKHYYGNNRILYLTLFGSLPKKDTLGGLVEGHDFFSISYRKEIARWIESCIEIAKGKKVESTIQQYLSLINELTNQTDEQMDKNRIFEVMVKYPQAVNEIYSNGYEYWWYVYDNKVKNGLREVANRHNLIFDDSQMIPQGNASFSFYRESWNNNKNKAYIVFETESSRSYRNYYVGITSTARALSWNKHELDCLNEGHNDWWPLGWCTLERFSDWTAGGETLVAMTDGRFVKFINDKITEILDELDAKGIDLSEML